MRRILAICTSHIGGVLLVTPALDLLSKFFPSAEISVLVREGTESMLRNHPRVKTLYVEGEITSNQRMYERTKSSFSRRLAQIPRGLKLIGKLRREKFDLVVDFNGTDRGAIFAFLSGAKARACYEPRGGFWGKGKLFTQLCSRLPGSQHKVLQNTELVFQTAAAHGAGVTPRPAVGPLVLNSDASELAWAQTEWRKVAGDQHPRIVVHPTSRVRYKCWAPAKWIAVIGWLQSEMGARVIVTCSPDPREMEMAQAIVDGCAARPAALLGELNLDRLAALIREADFFLGVDSAPMHMAAAVGTPVVAVFGPSRDERWGPWGEGHRVVRRPCGCLELKTPRCPPAQGMDCLNAVAVDDVCRAVREIRREPASAAAQEKRAL